MVFYSSLISIWALTTESKMSEWKTVLYKGNTNMALHVCRKYNSVLYSYIGWLIDEHCTPSPPPHPLANPQTAPIGIGIGYRGGRWVRKRVCGGREWRRARQSPIC